MSLRKNNIDLIEYRVKKFREDAADDLQGLNAMSPDQTKQDNLELYREESLYYRQKYEAIRDASFWKMTAPLRKAADIYRYIRTEHKREKEPGSPLLKTAVSVNGKARIGVHLHLYYEDLLEEFCTYLDNIPEVFDIYISCKKGINRNTILEAVRKIHQVNQVTVKETENRGRDLAPFYVLFRKELQQYPLLLHIHSKKSLYSGGENTEWRHWALDGVLKNRDIVSNILQLMTDANHPAGLVFGEMNPSLPLFALHWLRNVPRGVELLGRMGITLENNMLFYPVGSFFWVKRETAQPIFDLKLTYSDFEKEQGQIDGTTAHALERVIACTNEFSGYGMYIFDPRSCQFFHNKSYNSFQNYFSMDSESVEKRLEAYDVITFDIFDTLITRLVYRPDDLFLIMEQTLKKKKGIEYNFLKRRKKAEALASEEYGDFCNIHHIYHKLPLVSEFSEDEAQEIMQMEIDLEHKLCVPRRDVLELYQKLLKKGKKIILISDMYLTAVIISGLLEECGFTGYEDLWISCEKGKRKDRDTIWDDFFQEYGKLKTIHIGDNPHSDCQLLSDRGRDYLLLLSSAEQFRLSKQYKQYKPYLNGAVGNSLVLGYMVNQCLYNSPFALTQNGTAHIDSPDMLSKGFYGPLFLKFCEYIHRTSKPDSILLFLAREGYFFQRLYKKYCQVFQIKELQNIYFLTSRRATSVAQIETYADAKELLSTNFSGKLSSLFSERFGLELSGLEKDEQISIPRDIKKVIKIMSKHAQEILIKAQDEKIHYLKYAHQELGEDVDWSRITMVDLGYAGTIQYYFMKIVQAPLDGCYMITDYRMKPEKVYGTTRGLYSFWESKRFDENKLFLESVAAAPHGQVIRFQEQNGVETAVLKNEAEKYADHALLLQEPVYQYLEDMARLLEGLDANIDKNLVECIFSESLQKGALSKEMQAFFTVEDGYCEDGEWIFDEEKNKWTIKKDI